MGVRELLLTIAYRNQINEPNIEAGFERFVAVSGEQVAYNAFCDMVADCLRDKLIREPIRLPEGSLQCHWHLELTAAGVAAAREMIAVSGDAKIRRQNEPESNPP